eukprot:403334443
MNSNQPMSEQILNLKEVKLKRLNRSTSKEKKVSKNKSQNTQKSLVKHSSEQVPLKTLSSNAQESKFGFKSVKKKQIF